MVKIEKDYVFDGPNGKQTLKALFEGRRQLIVYHSMFDRAWDKGCPGCTAYVNALGVLSMLNDRDTTFVVISRAPLPKLEAYKAQKDLRSRECSVRQVNIRGSWSFAISHSPGRRARSG